MIAGIAKLLAQFIVDHPSIPLRMVEKVPSVNKAQIERLSYMNQLALIELYTDLHSRYVEIRDKLQLLSETDERVFKTKLKRSQFEDLNNEIAHIETLIRKDNE